MRDELVVLVRELLAEAEQTPDEPLGDATSLIESGLLDSVLILSLAEWIDRHVAAPIDLNDVDIVGEWDTIARILDYVCRHA